jgi:hypothetical protein
MTTQAAVLRWVDQVSILLMIHWYLIRFLFCWWYLISFMCMKKTEIMKQWFEDLSEAKFCYFGKWNRWSSFQVYTITYSSIFNQCYDTIVLAKVPTIISSYIFSQCCWVITIYKYWITKSPAQSCVLGCLLIILQNKHYKFFEFLVQTSLQCKTPRRRISSRRWVTAHLAPNFPFINPKDGSKE